MKMKELFSKSTKYLRELSVVVIGITITFALNNWISRTNDEKDLQRYLSAVHAELEYNLEGVHNMYNYHKRMEDFSSYLRSIKPEHISQDSLQKYSDVIKSRPISIYQTSAFEMLKMSGTMRLIKDKSVFKSIMDIYALLDAGNKIGEIYFTTRQELLAETALNTPNTTFELVINNFSVPTNRRLYNFHSMENNSSPLFQYIANETKKTLEQFPKE